MPNSATYLAMLDFLKSIIIPLVAVFLGAYFAYRYQYHLHREKKSDDDIENITKAYLTITKQMNQLAVMVNQFCDEILLDQFVAAVPFDYRRQNYLDDSNLSCIALNNADLYIKIQEADNGYDVVLNLVNRYNSIIDIKNDYFLFNSLGAILERSLEIITHDQIVVEDIFSFVTAHYKRKEYLRVTIPDLDKDKILNRIKRIKLKIKQLEDSTQISPE